MTGLNHDSETAKKRVRSTGAKKLGRAPKRQMARPGHKSIEEIAREQGKELRPWTDADFARMRQLGKGLFRSRKELEDFVAGIHERRRQSRGD